MQHIFSSGEILYQQNIKALPEGKLTAEAIAYDNIEDNDFIFHGTIEDRKVMVQCRLVQEDFEKVSFKSQVHILMPSDILQAKWSYYKVVLD